MRRLQAEPGQGGFDAEKLINPPLVFIWIPVGIIVLGMAYCAVRYALRRRRTVPRGVKNVLYYPSEFEAGVDRAQQPQDDDRPLPRRTLARISHASNASGLPASERGVPNDSSGTILGITHAQLQKLQLADIANMLLPDRTNSIHSQSGGLPFVTVGSQGSASVMQDATSDTSFAINDIYHDAVSGKDFSAPLDNMSSPSPVARRGVHSRNMSQCDEGSGPFQPPMAPLSGNRDPNRHVWSPMQPQPVSSLPTTPQGRKSMGKSLRSPPPTSAVDPNRGGFAAAVDGVHSQSNNAPSGYGDEVDRMDPVDIEL